MAATSFAVFSIAALIWVTPQGRVLERVDVKQLSPSFTQLNACRDDLENKITSRLASASHVVADAVKTSVHAGNPNDHLARVHDLLACLPLPLSADTVDALTD